MSVDALEKLVLGLLALCMGLLAALRRSEARRREPAKEPAPVNGEARYIGRVLNNMRLPPKWEEDFRRIAEERDRESMGSHDKEIRDKIELLDRLSQQMLQLQIQVAQTVDDVMEHDKRITRVDERVHEIERVLALSMENLARITADIPKLTAELVLAKISSGSQQLDHS